MTASELLSQAMRHIEDTRRWCVGRLAENAVGKTVHPRSGDAVAWCAAGALEAQAGAPDQDDSQANAESFLSQACDPYTVESVNDGLGHEAVMDRFKAAVALAQVFEADP